ncbi:MAG: GAF domain-containing protein, partial [Polyangiaceae bacterium]
MGEQETQSSAVEIRRLKDRLRVLSDATRAFAENTTNYQALLDGVSKKLADILQDTCVVMLLSPDETALLVLSVHAPTDELATQLRKMLSDAPLTLADHPILANVVRTGETLLIPRLPPREPIDTASGKTDYERIVKTHSLLVVALRLNGKSIGIVALSRFREESPPFDDHDRDLAQTLADHAALAIGNARAYVEAQATRAELHSARSRFASLEKSGLLGILVYRATVGVIEVDDTLLKMIGYSREEVLTPGFAWIDLTPPEWNGLDVQAGKELA